QRMAGNLIADTGSWAGDQVDGSGREVSLDYALQQFDRERGSRRSRCPYDGISARERRRYEFGGHGQRPVPGRDHRIDPARHTKREDQLVWAHGWDDARLEPLDVLCRDPEIFDCLAHLAQGFSLVGLALVERQPAGKFLAAALHDVG